MHTFLQKPIKQLKWRKLTSQEIGPYRKEMINLLEPSPDPFSSVMYQINIGPCKEQAKLVESSIARRITLTPIIIKLIAHAIAENHVFNQMLCGRSIYQLEEIHIANITLLPGIDAASCVILENPHKKSLGDIQQELFAGIEKEKMRMLSPPHPLVTFFTHLCYRYALYRLIGERRAFSIAYERGLLSNIFVSIHTYATPANFTMVKDVVTAMNATPRFHINGPVQKPVFENDLLVSKEMLEVHVTTDHRIIDGIHSYQFGQTLEKITAQPDRYFI